MTPQAWCSLAGFEFVVRVRPENWDADIGRFAEASEWLRSKGGVHDTVENGFTPRSGTVAMWWPEWNSGHAVYCYAFSDLYLATEFRIAFG